MYCSKMWLDIVLHDFNLTYYSSIILGSFSILLFPKLCWHIGLTPNNWLSGVYYYSMMYYYIILDSFCILLFQNLYYRIMCVCLTAIRQNRYYTVQLFDLLCWHYAFLYTYIVYIMFIIIHHCLCKSSAGLCAYLNFSFALMFQVYWHLETQELDICS